MKIKIILIGVCSLLLLSNSVIELERINVVNNDLSMLMPKKFIQITKEDYKPAYPGDPIPEDYYSNADKSIEVSFLKIPKQSDDLIWCKDFLDGAFLGNKATFYFNDIVSVGNTKIHLAEYDGVFQGKGQFCKMFFINLKEYTIIGNISCEMKFKKEWSPTADEIFESIQIN